MSGISTIIFLIVVSVVWLIFGIIELTRKPTMLPAIIAPIVFSIFTAFILYLTRNRIYAKRVELTPDGLAVTTWRKIELIPLDNVRSIVHQEGNDGPYCWLNFTDGRNIVFSSCPEAKVLLEAISEAIDLPFVYKKGRFGT